MESELAKAEQPGMAIVPMDGSLFFNVSKFELAQRVANVFASSTMVPDHFKGNIGNCLIALNLAERMQCDPFMLLQNMYIVHGKPGIEAKLAIALVNASGKFTPIQYEFNDNKTACVAHANRTGSGEVCRSVPVTIQMAKDEGWMSKSGSKWKTMPELMLQYRSAMFFARAYCPEALLGMQSKEELHDTYDMTPGPGGYEIAKPDSAGDLAAKLEAIDEKPEPKKIAGQVPDENGNLAFDAKEHVVQHGTHNLSHTNTNGKYGDIMPDGERDVGKTQGADPKPDPEPKTKVTDYWDPLKAPIQMRYAGGKKERVMEALDKRGIGYSPTWPGPQLHAALLKNEAIRKTTAEYEAKAQAEQHTTSEAEGVAQREGINDDSPPQHANFDSGPAGYDEPASQPKHNTVIPAHESEEFLKNERKDTNPPEKAPENSNGGEPAPKYFHDIDELVGMPALLQDIYGEMAEKHQCMSEELSPKSVNSILKRRYPIQWERARQALGFSFIAQTDDAADRWNLDTIALVE